MKLMNGSSCRILTAVLVSGFLICPQMAGAQFSFMQPHELPAIDAATQRAIVDSLAAGLEYGYVFADVAAKMVAHARSALADGAYRDLTDPVLFVRQVGQDMRSICNDWHFETAVLAPADPSSPEETASPIETEAHKARLRRMNYGFRKVEILPGNIGYLELLQFADASLAGETAVSAMNFLANVDALIIDLRRNGGGNAEMIQLLTGYLLDEQTHLVSWYHRDTDEMIQSWTPAYVPGRRLVETPVYILTSCFTGSAAEEFTYNLKNLERATVIGDTTAGGAHTVSFLAYDFVEFRVGLKLPSGRAISPITETNWEGTGVAPHIEAAEEEALLVARVEALKELRGRDLDDDSRGRLEWALAGVEAELRPVTLSKKELNEYTGTFGPRRIFLDGDDLYYQREERPRYRLLPMGDHTFRLEGLDTFRLRFARSDGGEIDQLIGLYDNGRQDTDMKTR